MSDIEKTISLKGLDQMVADVNRFKAELDGIKAKYKELSAQTKKDTDDHLGDLKSMAAGYLSVTSIYGQLTAAATEYLAMQQRITDEYGKQTNAQTQTLFLAGQLSQGKNVDAFVQSNRGYDVKKAQAAIGGAMEGGTGIEFFRQEAVAREVMAAGHLMDAGAIGVTAQLGGRLAKAGIQDAGDAAIVATQLTGKEANLLGSRKAQSSLQSLLEAGFKEDRALAMVTAAVDSDLGPKYMDKYLDALSSTEQVGFTTETHKAKFLRTNGMFARDELLRSDEEVRKAVLGEKGSNEFLRTSSRLGEFEKAFAGRDGVGGRALADALQSESGADAIDAARRAAKKSQKERRAATQFDPWADIAESVGDAIDEEYRYSGVGMALPYRVDRFARTSRILINRDSGASAADTATREVNAMTESGYKPEVIRDLIETLRENGLLTERLLSRDAAATVPSRSPHSE